MNIHVLRYMLYIMLGALFGASVSLFMFVNASSYPAFESIYLVTPNFITLTLPKVFFALLGAFLAHRQAKRS